VLEKESERQIFAVPMNHERRSWSSTGKEEYKYNHERRSWSITGKEEYKERKSI